MRAQVVFIQVGDEVLPCLALEAVVASQIHSGKLKARFVSCCRQVGSWEGWNRKGGGEGGEAMQQKWIATEEGLTSGEQIVPNHAWSEEGGTCHIQLQIAKLLLEIDSAPQSNTQSLMLSL